MHGAYPRHLAARSKADDANMNKGDRLRLRADQRAEHILEEVLHRRRWAAADRDRIADELIRFHQDEQRRG